MSFAAEHYIAMTKTLNLKVAWAHLAYNVVGTNVVHAVLAFPTGNTLTLFVHVKCTFSLKVILAEVNTSYNLNLCSC